VYQRDHHMAPSSPQILVKIGIRMVHKVVIVGQGHILCVLVGNRVVVSEG